jgi:hypothetical protein
VFSAIAIEEEQNTLSPMEPGVGVDKTADQQKLYAMLFSHRHIYFLFMSACFHF